jgi:ferredoxin-NADP reductase
VTGVAEASAGSRRTAGESLLLRVTAKTVVAEDVVRVDFAGETSLPPWSPGAHVELHLADGLSRQYSLCSSPESVDSWSVAVLLEMDGRGGSRHVHELLHVGDVVQATGPRDNFHFDPASRYVFVAGGIGITPIIPMIEAAERARATWRLIYGGRTRDSMAFVSELAAHGERVSLMPFDRTGHPDLRAEFQQVQEDTLIYCCGPEGLLRAAEAATGHWPAGSLRVERFAVASPDEDSASGFRVELLTSQMTLDVPPDKSILEVAEDAGVWVPSSCQAGTCGTCETRVAAGIPDHRDAVLSDDEKAANDYMMICVSRALSDSLTLEL